MKLAGRITYIHVSTLARMKIKYPDVKLPDQTDELAWQKKRGYVKLMVVRSSLRNIVKTFIYRPASTQWAICMSFVSSRGDLIGHSDIYPVSINQETYIAVTAVCARVTVKVKCVPLRKNVPPHSPWSMLLIMDEIVKKSCVFPSFYV